MLASQANLWRGEDGLLYPSTMTADPRSNRGPRSVGQLMSDEEATFGRVLKRARALEKLNLRVQGLLDPEVARRCRVANVRAGQLIFACTSQGVATRLRLQSPQLLERLHAAGLEEIEEIEVRMMVTG